MEFLRFTAVLVFLLAYSLVALGQSGEGDTELTPLSGGDLKDTEAAPTITTTPPAPTTTPNPPTTTATPKKKSFSMTEMERLMAMGDKGVAIGDDTTVYDTRERVVNTMVLQNRMSRMTKLRLRRCKYSRKKKQCRARLLRKERRETAKFNKQVKRKLRVCQSVMKTLFTKAEREFKLLLKQKKVTPASRHITFNLPSDKARKIAQTREKFDFELEQLCAELVKSEGVDGKGIECNPTEDLDAQVVLDLLKSTGCSEARKVPFCWNRCQHVLYRTTDGSCNNRNNPAWGSSAGPYRRLVPARYENGLSTPLGWTAGVKHNGYELPSARVISSIVMTAEDHIREPTTKATDLLNQWGQFNDHDIDHTPATASHINFVDGRSCAETCENKAPCFPIPIPDNDKRIRKLECLGFTRSAPACANVDPEVCPKRFLTREQMNQITPFVDSSMVYGSNDDMTKAVRGPGGMLKVTRKFYGLEYPPLAGDNSNMACSISAAFKGNTSCFLVGDARGNEQIGLTALHIIFVREHNRLAAELSKLNPKWKSETIFQETRKIVAAQNQIITYDHFLPLYIGSGGMKHVGAYTIYHDNVEPQISNAFATAAYRCGHALVSSTMSRLDKDYSQMYGQPMPLHQAFFAPHKLVHEGGIDPLLRGMYRTPIKDIYPGNIMSKELTERLFAMNKEVALDLGSLNIQRGRDHGLGSWMQYRERCRLSTPKTWEGLLPVVGDQRIVDTLKQLYGSPLNVDLFVGGLCEPKLPDGQTGPTFACILGDTFRSIRDGDRFWYENNQFTFEQLQELKKTSLGRILCDNGDDINSVTDNVFVHNSKVVKCDDVPRIDLSKWKMADPLEECKRITEEDENNLDYFK